MKPRIRWAVPAAVILSLAGSTRAHAIPQWAREYDVDCTQCHTSVPRLNRFGGEFVANNYQWPDSLPRPRRWTVPLAVWASGRSESLPPGNVKDDAVRGYLNRLEIISGGKVVVPWLSYFVEWRPVSLEGRSDGTLRDRSGRFEDLFLTVQRDALEITVGQFRQIAQVDISRRLGISEPLVLSASLPGSEAGLARDAKGKLAPGEGRRLSLRGFSPAGRSPSVRVGWNQPVQDGWSWTTSAALPLPGEISVPLTREARVEASNELEWDPKGVVVESFVRRGAVSLGGHVLYDHSERHLTQAIATGKTGSFYWTGVAGLARTRASSTVEPVLRGRWSAEAEFIPHHLVGVGGRVENRAGDRAEPAFIPYLNAHFPGTRGTVRFTVEQRFQKDRNGTFIELGTIF